MNGERTLGIIFFGVRVLIFIGGLETVLDSESELKESVIVGLGMGNGQERNGTDS